MTTRRLVNGSFTQPLVNGAITAGDVKPVITEEVVTMYEIYILPLNGNPDKDWGRLTKVYKTLGAAKAKATRLMNTGLYERIIACPEGWSADLPIQMARRCLQGGV